jgi:hypothetical protein
MLLKQLTICLSMPCSYRYWSKPVTHGRGSKGRSGEGRLLAKELSLVSLCINTSVKTYLTAGPLLTHDLLHYVKIVPDWQKVIPGEEQGLVASNSPESPGDPEQPSTRF